MSARAPRASMQWTREGVKRGVAFVAFVRVRTAVRVRVRLVRTWRSVPGMPSWCVATPTVPSSESVHEEPTRGECFSVGMPTSRAVTFATISSCRAAKSRLVACLTCLLSAGREVK